MDNKNTLGRLGPLEVEIVARLTYDKKTLVTGLELDRLFKLSPVERAKVVSRLKRKNILSPVKRGVYLFSPLEAGPSGRGIDELLIPPLYCPRNNYYVGYSTMFNYYGFSEQMFQTVYILNTSFAKEKTIGGISFKFLKIPPKRLYGRAQIEVKGTPVFISDKERTLIDLLYFNKPVGGISPAVEIFRSIVKKGDCDVKKVIDYACRFPNVTLRKRAGVLLEGLGIKESWLRPLAKTVRGTAVGSLGKSRRGALNKKWRVLVDASSG
jgi:predicted transcriptional regulator of viral defense system